MSMPALRVALYARVSSDQQTEQGTIASQVAALEAPILQDGLPLEPDHRFIDEGHSGATLIRPALESAVSECVVKRRGPWRNLHRSCAGRRRAARPRAACADRSSAWARLRLSPVWK